MILEKGYYMFKCNIVNASTQSVVAMASYRSGEKLHCEKDGLTRSYKERFVKPETFIMKPSHAPDWTLEREKLWNEVERFENRDNARLARNIVMSLPNDMTNEQQLELTKEFVKENFVDEGMVADVAIHRDDVNNPHVHVLLTVREFDKNGEWEKRKSKRIPKLDENGNQMYNEKGWRKTVSVKLNDWDKEETLIRWRKNWAEKLNEKSLKYGLNKVYSHKSFKEQGRLKKAQLHLTRSEYQFEERRKKEAEKNGTNYEPKCYYAKKNEEIKEYNKQFDNIIHLEDYKTQKDYKKELDNLRYKMHVNENKINATRLLVSRIKGYVDYQSASKLYYDFTDNHNKWKMNLERKLSINKTKEQVFNKMTERFKDNPNSVLKYGYSINNFHEEIKNELLKTEQERMKLLEEYNKFNELKQATIISLSYQKELLDMEFSAVYENVNIEDFNYDEKYFAIKMLKDYNIKLPENEIRKEMINQGKYKEYEKMYTPVWKQAKDLMTSIRIYDRTLNKIKNQSANELTKEDFKESVIKLNSYAKLKKEYEEHLKELSPLIDENIRQTFQNEALNNASLETKLEVLEAYSKLSEYEKENIDQETFIKQVQEEQENKAQFLEQKGRDEKDDKNIYKEESNKAENIANSLFDAINEASQDRGNIGDRKKRDKTKTYRRRSADGREL